MLAKQVADYFDLHQQMRFYGVEVAAGVVLP
jgi:hypothetical protein